MPEAVIVATGRTPIGRANKGSLVECRPDDLSALVLRAVLDKVPQLDPAQVEDVLLGCSCGTLSSTARSTRALRSSGRHSTSEPLLARPIGVRPVATMTASGM